MTARKSPPPSESPQHYDLLAEYHISAAAAANRIRYALESKAKADAELAEARRKLANTRDLIDKWYREHAPGDPA
jgi:L-fucose isomerase-like protein